MENSKATDVMLSWLLIKTDFLMLFRWMNPIFVCQNTLSGRIWHTKKKICFEILNYDSSGQNYLGTFGITFVFDKKWIVLENER